MSGNSTFDYCSIGRPDGGVDLIYWENIECRRRTKRGYISSSDDIDKSMDK